MCFVKLLSNTSLLVVKLPIDLRFDLVLSSTFLLLHCDNNLCTPSFAASGAIVAVGCAIMREKFNSSRQQLQLTTTIQLDFTKR